MYRNFLNNMKTKINNPIIEGYINDFINKNEIAQDLADDKHKIFEQYINQLLVDLYGNDPNASYEDMETGTSFGIDGIGIFISDSIVNSIEDVDDILSRFKKVEINFIFMQAKTSNKVDRQEISSFLLGVKRFFNLEICEIPELSDKWEIMKYIYSKKQKFKETPNAKLYYVTLSSKTTDPDNHLIDTIKHGLEAINNLVIVEEIKEVNLLGIRDIMSLHDKNISNKEATIIMSKPPISYPKSSDDKIESAYYGLIKLEEFVKLLVENRDGKNILKKGIFDDNIRYYLGTEKKYEVNNMIKNQLLGEEKHLFGLLNNGITVICDKININSEEVNLINYQIVNGCQTSNIIFECLEQLEKNNNIFLPIRLIATSNESTKNSIIRATNTQTPLRPEQLTALLPIQKSLEKYYESKRESQDSPLYYERRTAQYRDENIQKSRIITIPIQIKATSALILDRPHDVSGQYGRVEKAVRGELFKEDDFDFLNVYYISGLLWYKVERFLNSKNGIKYKRARWHIIMLIKYLICDKNEIHTEIKKSKKISEKIERNLKKEENFDKIIIKIIDFLEEIYSENININKKLFERKDTTTFILDNLEKLKE